VPRVALVTALVLAALSFTGAAHARECGIPDANPLWVDYAAHDSPVPHKPGLTLAFTSGTEKPAAARAAGAATIFFDLNFNRRVGTPTLPADPATIVERADRLYDFAVSVTGCRTPWIAENELFGAQTVTPWTATTAQYRENTLILLRRLKERGAVPFVTVANPPFTGGEAADWWRELAKTAVIVRQVFFTDPNPAGLHRLGAVRASRAMRTTLRALVRRFTSIGIPASRVALELQFHSAPGTGGREGLQPRWKWLEIVKLQALAVQRVTHELKTHSIWSWGWATYSTAGIDRDKGEAVCVYLWVRDPKLCSGPGAAGPALDDSLTVGQLEQLPAGVTCRLPVGDVTEEAVLALAKAVGDRNAAASVVLERVVLASEIELDARDVLGAELAFVDDRFGGSVGAYARALAKVGLSRSAARALLADELRREAVRARFRVRTPSLAAMTEFQRTYGERQARWVHADRPVGWLGGARRGLALETFAPRRLFALERRGVVRTIHGRIGVRPLGPVGALGELPLFLARPAIEVALARLGRMAAYTAWLQQAERRALDQALCAGDELPQPATIALDDLLLPAGD
jgi:hypothetical protein